MKKIVVLIILCIIVFNFAKFLYAEEKTPLKGVQILTFQSKNLEEIETVISKLKDIGVNTIIVRCFQNKGDRSLIQGEVLQKTGVYFKTDYAPLINDVLKDLISVAHKHNMKIFAWMETLKCPWAIEKHPEWRSKEFDIDRSQIVSINKLDIFNKKVQNYLINLYKDLAKYPIDGILFQDDLMLVHSEGFTQSALKKYKNDFGANLSSTDLFVKHGFGKNFPGDIYTDKFWKWANWKGRKLLNFITEIEDTVRKINPNIKFALNCYYEEVLFPKRALAWFSHSLEKAQHYDFDYYFIMAYHRQIRKELELSKRSVDRKMKSLSWRIGKEIKNSNKIVMKIQTKDWNNGKSIPKAEIDRIYRLLIRNEKVGLVFIPYYKGMNLELLRQYF